MQSRFTDEGLGKALREWSESGADVGACLYIARLVGAEPTLVLHGGGNLSVKRQARSLVGEAVEVAHVKASGHDMATLDVSGLPAVRLAPLRKLRSLERLDDDEMVNQFRTNLLVADSPTPSIETLVHLFLPHRFVLHSHANAVLTLTNQPDGEACIREALGGDVAILPYVRPGFELAREVVKTAESEPQINAQVWLNHGLVTFGSDERQVYERHIALVDRCERFIERELAVKPRAAAVAKGVDPSMRVAKIAPALRGLLAAETGENESPLGGPILEWRTSHLLLGILADRGIGDLAKTGPLTGDHLIHTKPHSLLLTSESNEYHDDLQNSLKSSLGEYRNAYADYLRKHGGSSDVVDLNPRVVLVPGVGLLAWGPNKRAARITADIAEQTLIVKSKAQHLGRYVSLPPDKLYEMEFRGLQRLKLGAPRRRSLEGRIVAVSGGAGAIGAGIAEVCLEAGAHVALCDISEDRLTHTVLSLRESHGGEAIAAVPVDVTSEESVAAAFAEITRTFGGVDVVVPNAGIALVAALDKLAVGDLQHVINVNAIGCFLFLREGARLLKAQGIGGSVVLISSKNVFAPGAEFGAYSASKAAAHQLGRVAAVELAPVGVHVNMVNPDAVFGDAENRSGLWETVGPDRARGRNLSMQDLEEYYRNRSLLKTRVTARHVGNAVVFFASQATPTTGASLPVDGGLTETFSR